MHVRDLEPVRENPELQETVTVLPLPVDPLTCPLASGPILGQFIAADWMRTKISVRGEFRHPHDDLYRFHTRLSFVSSLCFPPFYLLVFSPHFHFYFAVCLNRVRLPLLAGRQGSWRRVMVSRTILPSFYGTYLFCVIVAQNGGPQSKVII